MNIINNIINSTNIDNDANISAFIAQLRHPRNNIITTINIININNNISLYCTVKTI